MASITKLKQSSAQRGLSQQANALGALARSMPYNAQIQRAATLAQSVVPKDTVMPALRSSRSSSRSNTPTAQLTTTQKDAILGTTAALNVLNRATFGAFSTFMPATLSALNQYSYAERAAMTAKESAAEVGLLSERLKADERRDLYKLSWYESLGFARSQEERAVQSLVERDADITALETQTSQLAQSYGDATNAALALQGAQSSYSPVAESVGIGNESLGDKLKNNIGWLALGAGVLFLAFAAGRRGK